MPSKNIICSGKRNLERSRYDLDQVMAMRLTAVATPAEDLNISLSGLDRTEKLEQEASRGTLLPFLASDPYLSCHFLWYFSPPVYKGVPLEGNIQMLPGNIKFQGLERYLMLRGIGEELKGRTHLDKPYVAKKRSCMLFGGRMR